MDLSYERTRSPRMDTEIFPKAPAWRSVLAVLLVAGLMAAGGRVPHRPAEKPLLTASGFFR